MYLLNEKFWNLIQGEQSIISLKNAHVNNQ